MKAATPGPGLGFAARTFAGLLGLSVLGLALLLGALWAGQLLGPLSDLVRLAGPDLPLGGILSEGALVLLEGALPLVALLACGLVFGRLRGEGGWVAFSSLGLRPVSAWGPVLALGLLLGGAALALAHEVVPAAVTRLGQSLQSAAAHGLAAARREVRLPGGGVARRDGAGVFWAVLPEARGATLLRAAEAAARFDAEGLHLELADAVLWSPRLRLKVAKAHLRLDAGPIHRRLGMFGPPNALATVRLDPTSRHHRFVAARRTAQAVAALAWAWLGAALGLGWGPARAVLAGAACVGGAYELLRTGELAARAGFGSPTFAAWAPTLVLLGVAALLWPRAWRRIDPA
jgi:hypothetical protein